MTNIEQFTRELMLAHDIDYETAQYRAFNFYENLAQDVPSVLNDWISVEDRLPEKGMRVLVYDNMGFGLVSGYHSTAGWYIEGNLDLDSNVTHWQPLPKPPQPKEK